MWLNYCRLGPNILKFIVAASNIRFIVTTSNASKIKM